LRFYFSLKLFQNSDSAFCTWVSREQ